jgi:hypothetical protein
MGAPSRRRWFKMTKRTPPRNGGIVAGSDWSLGFNRVAGDSQSYAYLLERIGRELQRTYGDPKGEPVPEHLAHLVRRLEKSDEKPDG